MAFFRRVNPCFWSKNAIFFHYLFSLKVRLELGVNNVRDRKTTFFDYKKFSKIAFLQRGSPMCLVKKCHFFHMFLVKTRLEIVLTEFVDKKETFFDYKN